MVEMELVTVKNLVKQFKTVRAVDRVSFGVREGEIFALLGPNGAGKTTVVRIILNIIRADDGSVSYHRPGDGQTALSPRAMGYLPEDRGLYPQVGVLKTLVYMGMLRSMTKANARQAAEKWLSNIGLQDRGNENLGSLSKGNQQLIQLAASLIHRPRLALLDEPFAGLDPINQQRVIDLIENLRKSGMTVILNSHQMELVERIADRVLLMSEGREVLSGTVDEVRQRGGGERCVSLSLECPPDSKALERLASVATVDNNTNELVQLTVSDKVALSEVLSIAGDCLKIQDVSTRPLSLYDVYIRTLNRARPTDPINAAEINSP